MGPRWNAFPYTTDSQMQYWTHETLLLFSHTRTITTLAAHFFLDIFASENIFIFQSSHKQQQQQQ